MSCLRISNVIVRPLRQKQNSCRRKENNNSPEASTVSYARRWMRGTKDGRPSLDPSTMQYVEMILMHERPNPLEGVSSCQDCIVRVGGQY